MVPPDHKETYRSETENYDQLIAREDFQGNLLREIERICPPDGLDILDLGAGTGRFETLLAERAASITALDLSHAMLKIARGKLVKLDTKNHNLIAADHRALPLRNHFFDMVISGWSICYLADWYPETWREELDRAFIEIRRVTRSGGRVILLETQGTGFESPTPPPHLADYFVFLQEAGFQFTWARTDYQFHDLDEAITISRFFFGEELAARVRANEWIVLPECTGFWTRTLP
jgi:ubiquinone/menaquinone biosynthesis C-methylase UbiE